MTTTLQSELSTVPPGPKLGGRPGLRWIKPILLLAVFLAFARICDHQFLGWDDDSTIQFNPRISEPSLQNVLYYWTHPHMDLYVPVTYTIWSAVASADRAFTGRGLEGPLDPTWFHVVSVVAHLINTLLVYELLRRLIRRPWPAAAGALLFGLHPVQVEAVAWASGLKDVLCATFSLVALIEYVKAAEPPQTGQRKRLHYVMGMTAMLLGTLCKPTAVVTPMLAIILDLLILRRPLRKAIKAAAPWFAIAVPCLIWTKLCQPAGNFAVPAIWQRPLIAADAMAFYLCKLAAPIHLTFDYGRDPITAIAKGWVYWTWLLPATVAALIVLHRDRARVLAAAGLLLIAGVAPVLGLVPFDFQMTSTVADHYLYLAMLGPALAAAWALGSWRLSVRWPGRGAAVVVLGLLAGRTIHQAGYWRDSRTFFAHGLDLRADSWTSCNGLAVAAHNEAIELAQRARRTAEQGGNPTADRAAADVRFAEAMNLYRWTLQLKPGSVTTRHSYAMILMHFGRWSEAAKEFAEVVHRRDLLPRRAREQFFVDSDLLGQALYRGGRPAEAAEAFRAALRLQPPPPGAAEHLRAAEAAPTKTPGLPQPPPAVAGSDP